MGREVVALNYDAVKFYVQLRECAHCNGSSKERYGLVTPPRSSGGIFATRYTRSRVECGVFLAMHHSGTNTCLIFDSFLFSNLFHQI